MVPVRNSNWSVLNETDQLEASGVVGSVTPASLRAVTNGPAQAAAGSGGRRRLPVSPAS